MTNVLRLLWVMCHVLCSRDLPFDSYDRRDLLLHPSARGGAAAVLQGECIARGRTPVVQCWLSFGHRDPVSEPASAHFLRLHSGQRRIGILLWVRRGKQGQSWHIPGMELDIHQMPPPPKISIGGVLSTNRESNGSPSGFLRWKFRQHSLCILVTVLLQVLILTALTLGNTDWRRAPLCGCEMLRM